jgi:S1-C subfamily serine protease
MRLRYVAVAVIVAGVAGGLIGAAAMQATGDDDNGITASVPANDTTAEDEQSPQVTSLSEGCLSASDIYEMVRPSVVRVNSASAQSQGTGTGVVIDEDGHVLTNNHVISGASTVEVVFADGSTSDAEVVGTDPANDLAVLDITDTSIDLQPAELGDSGALRVGDSVLALGTPFSLEGTLTQGIVSALDRTYATGGSTRPIRDMIQTDAAVNPGNSGGPLLNCAGEVIGINTLLENPTGENVNVGIAFAVASNTAKQSLPEMLAGEAVSHPWLGIAGADVTPALADELGLSSDSGVYVTVVSSGSPADDAGLIGAFASANAAGASDELAPGGDVVVAVDGQEVSGIDEFAEYLAETKSPGDSVELTVERDGETITVTAELAEWPS